MSNWTCPVLVDILITYEKMAQDDWGEPSTLSTKTESSRIQVKNTVVSLDAVGYILLNGRFS